MKFAQIAIESNPVLLSEGEFFQRLALESTIGENIINFFSTGLPSLTQKITGYISTLTSLITDMPIDLIDKSFRALENNKLENSYLNYREILVQVPEGFKGEFLEFAIVLTGIAEHLYKDTTELFENHLLLLGNLITDPVKYSGTKDLSANYKHFTKAREVLEKKLKVFFVEGSISRQRLGDTVPQHRQLRELNRQMKLLSRAVSYSELKKIEALTSKTSSMLMVIEQQLKSYQISSISSETVRTMAAGTYEIAKYIDFIVTYNYATMSLVGCVSVLFEQLKELK